VFQLFKNQAIKVKKKNYSILIFKNFMRIWENTQNKKGLGK